MPVNATACLPVIIYPRSEDIPLKPAYDIYRSASQREYKRLPTLRILATTEKSRRLKPPNPRGFTSVYFGIYHTFLFHNQQVCVHNTMTLTDCRH